MKKIAFAALMVALCFVGEASAFHPGFGIGAGFGLHRGVFPGNFPVLRERELILRDRLLRDRLLRGRGTSYGVGSVPFLLRDQGLLGGGVPPSGLYREAGLNSCAPIAPAGIVVPSMSLRLRIN